MGGIEREWIGCEGDRYPSYRIRDSWHLCAVVRSNKGELLPAINAAPVALYLVDCNGARLYRVIDRAVAARAQL